MLDEAEKQRIIERVQFEESVRETVRKKDAESESPGESWLSWMWTSVQSNLGLLVIGAAITGVLIPRFQLHQENLNWRRQNRYDNQKYTLTMMRQGLEECVAVSAFPGKAYEIARPLLEDSDGLAPDPREVASQFTQLQNSRFEKNAIVVGSLVYFPDGEPLRKQFNSYLVAAGTYMRTIEEAMHTRMRLDRCRDEQCRATHSGVLDDLNRKLDGLVAPLNDAYDATVQGMKDDIGRLEHARETFE